MLQAGKKGTLLRSVTKETFTVKANAYPDCPSAYANPSIIQQMARG